MSLLVFFMSCGSDTYRKSFPTKDSCSKFHRNLWIEKTVTFCTCMMVFYYAVDAFHIAGSLSSLSFFFWLYTCKCLAFNIFTLFLIHVVHKSEWNWSKLFLSFFALNGAYNWLSFRSKVSKVCIWNAHTNFAVEHANQNIIQGF